MNLHRKAPTRTLGGCPAILLAAALGWSAPERQIAYGSRVAVLDPWAGTPADPVAKEFGDSLRSHLGANATIVPRPRLSGSEAPVPSPDSCADLACATRWGRAVGADRVVFGTLSKTDSGRLLIVEVADPVQARSLQTLRETAPASVGIPALAWTTGAHLWGMDPGPRRTFLPGRIQGGPDDTDVRIRKLKSELDQTKAVGASTGLLTLACFTIGVNPSNLGEARAWMFFGTLAFSSFTLYEWNHASDLEAKIRAIEKKRKTTFQLLPQVDPVHGSTGVFARVGF